MKEFESHEKRPMSLAELRFHLESPFPVDVMLEYSYSKEKGRAIYLVSVMYKDQRVVAEGENKGDIETVQMVKPLMDYKNKQKSYVDPRKAIKWAKEQGIRRILMDVMLEDVVI